MHTYKCILYYNQDLHSNRKFLILYFLFIILIIAILCNVTTVCICHVINQFAINRGYLKFYLGKKNNLFVIKLSAKKTKV